jgi:hypothetical protein
MRKLTKDYLETKDIEELGDILDELCSLNGYLEAQIDELFEDIIRRDDNFDLDKEDVIDWILKLQGWGDLKDKYIKSKDKRGGTE